MSIDRAADASGPTPRRLAPIVLGAVLVVALATLGPPAWRHLTEEPPPAPAALRLAFALPADMRLGAGANHPFGLALSPDGRYAAFAATDEGSAALWIRDLTTGTTRVLPGTRGATLPFWKPDGAAVGYFAAGRLMSVELDGGATHDLAPAPAARGGAWHPSGDVLFAPDDRGPLQWWRATSGAVEPFGTLDSDASETSHRFPAFVPDRDGIVVFFVRAERPAMQGIWAAPIGAFADRRRLAGGDAAGFVSEGWLVHASEDALVADRLDTASLAVAGPPVVLGLPVGRGPLNQLFASVSRTGLLVYGAPRDIERRLQWVTRTGDDAGTVGGPGDTWDVRIAPDGSAVAATQVDRQLATLDVWIYDGAAPVPRRLSPSLDADADAVWAPDGSRLAWVSGRRQVMTRGALGMLPETTLARFDAAVHTWAFTPDGASILVSLRDPATGDDLWMLPAVGDADPRPYVASPFNETEAAVSPDGRWLAYASDESGAFELYLDTFPSAGTRVRLTLGGGRDPRWRRDGRELYFRRGTAIHALALDLSGTTPALGATTRLFDAGADLRSYDATPDGRRFLLNVPAAADTAPALTAIVNWPSLVPAAPSGRAR
ncbi:MAG: hypothetical protein AB7O67_07935 [Vicinamibacterales bacterium]